MRPAASRFHGRNLVVPALILLAGLVVRLYAWPHQAIVTVDGTSYIRLARDLMGGPGYHTVQPPGYPLLMMPALAAFGGAADGVDAARGTALTAGLGAIALFWLLGRRWLGRWGSVAFGVALALTPILIRSSIITMSEMPYLLFAALSVLAAARGRPAAAGLMGGLAFHVRPEGMFLAAALAFVTAARGRLRAGLVILAGLVVAGFLPALLYNHAQSGSWSLTLKDSNIIADTPVLNESIRPPDAAAKPDPGLVARLSQFGAGSLAVWPKRFTAQLVNMARAVGWPALVAALAGLIVALRVRGPDSPVILAAGLVQLLIVPLFGGVAPAPRLIVPVLPFVLLLGILALERLAARRRTAGLAAALVVAAGWFIAAIPGARALKLQEDGYYPELVHAGRQLRGRVPATALIMDRKPYTAFYAGTRFEQVPFGRYHATLDAVQRAGGDFLVVDEAVAEVFRPDLLPLVRDSFTMLHESRLEPIWFDPSLANRHTAVYRVIRPAGAAPPFPPDDLARVRGMIAGLPHEPGLHALHAEILYLAGRKRDALAEYALAESAGTLRPVDAERRETMRAEVAAEGSRE